MQRFNFRLERVLGWKQTVQRLEELKLEQLYADARRIEAARESAAAERAGAAREVATWTGISGTELLALDAWGARLNAEFAKLTRAAAEARVRIEAQRAAVTTARRAVRLLETLRDRRLGEWTAAFNREIDAMAAEYALIRHARDSQPRL